MSRERMTASLICILLTVATSWFGCTTPPEQPRNAETQSRTQPAATAAMPSPQSSQSGQPANNQTVKEPSISPPKPNEIKEAVARVFENVATADAARVPNFVIGDFNGDGSEDLAVIVKANEGMLGEVNSEVANWTLEDPKKVFIPGQKTPSQPPAKPIHAEKGDTLLAIIHGVGPKGWRNLEAKQTFLLKNGAGAEMMAQSAKTLLNNKNKQKLPPLRGDAIRQTIAARSGLIFWTGAKYAWYSTAPE